MTDEGVGEAGTPGLSIEVCGSPAPARCGAWELRRGRGASGPAVRAQPCARVVSVSRPRTAEAGCPARGRGRGAGRGRRGRAAREAPQAGCPGGAGAAARCNPSRAVARGQFLHVREGLTTEEGFGAGVIAQGAQAQVQGGGPGQSAGPVFKFPTKSWGPKPLWSRAHADSRLPRLLRPALTLP